ncbi:archease [candidate division KSB1 bacterium]|nr:archease [candidate division KSB1 bacterium]
MKNYEQIEHTGDIGIRVFGESLTQLHENAAAAFFDLITPIELIHPKIERAIEVSAGDREELLVNWLSELNFVFQTEYLLFCEFRISELSETSLKAVVRGEALNLRQHHIKNEIKAVTFHGLKIERLEADNWFGNASIIGSFHDLQCPRDSQTGVWEPVTEGLHWFAQIIFDI